MPESGGIQDKPRFASDFAQDLRRYGQSSGTWVPDVLCVYTQRPRRQGLCPFRTIPGFVVVPPHTVGPPSTLRGTAGTLLFKSDDMISCIMQLPRLYALLPEDSIPNVWFGRDMSDQVCLVIRGMDMGPVYCRWNVGLFASDALQIRMDNPVVLRVVVHALSGRIRIMLHVPCHFVHLNSLMYHITFPGGTRKVA